MGRQGIPIFLDRHDMVEQTAEETAQLHIKDLENQDQYSVKFITYWLSVIKTNGTVERVS